MGTDIQKLIQLRKAKKLTITKVAKLLDKARSTVSDWENKKRTPSKTDLLALAQLYNCKISEISDYDDLHVERNLAEESIYSIKASEELKEIIQKYPDISSSGLKSLKYIVNENRRLETANRSLSKNKNRLTSIFNAINEIIYIKDRKRAIRKINNKFLEQLPPGYTAEDIIGSQAIDIFGRREIAEIIPLENSVFETGKPIVDEQIHIPGSCHKKHGLICIEPIFDAKDKVLEIAVSIKDVNDIIENLEKLELLKKIINNLEDVIWIEVPDENRYEFISESVAELSGYSAAEIQNNPSRWRSIIDHKDIQKLGLSQNHQYLNPGTYQLKIKHKNGSTKWIELRIYSSRTTTGKTFFYGINRDISAQKQP
ncbi:MAG: PAS domain S-box protein [Lentisphaerae bacterium]|nr:PAS domain S-box protein [Lentisphaerota bacterium]MCP4100181.1 PAS domain S-box protein [Lentisphaerota bacterium]